MKETAITVSNRQYVLLKEISHGGISLKRMLWINQTTGGSVVRRRFVRWDRKIERFVLTEEGERLMLLYKDAAIQRLNHDLPLSKYIPEVI